MSTRRPIPLWLPLLATIFLFFLIPTYWKHYGPSNFLWFSDVALFFATAALWLGMGIAGRSRVAPLLASMAAVGVLLPEIAWNLDFALHLVSGREVFGLTRYMFDSHYNLYLRLLSLFHVPLPPLLVWLVWRLGYDRRALAAQTLLAWLIYVTIYIIRPDKNINWAFGWGETPQKPSLLHLGTIMILYPLVVHVPTHFALLKLIGTPRR